MRLVTQLLCGLVCGAVAQFAAIGTAGVTGVKKLIQFE